MREVVMERRHPRGTWERLGSVAEVEPMGSFSSHSPWGRQVYMFGWHEDQVGVWKSTGGADVANPAIREVYTEGVRLLSDLAAPYEMVTILAGDRRTKLRFTLTESALAT